MNSILVIISCLFCLSCHVQHNTTFSTMTAKSNRIARKLANDSYGDFFNYLIQDQIIATVWAEAGGIAPLKAIIINEDAPLKARFLACEVLQQNRFIALRSRDVKAEVTFIYAQLKPLLIISQAWPTLGVFYTSMSTMLLVLSYLCYSYLVRRRFLNWSNY